MDHFALSVHVEVHMARYPMPPGNLSDIEWEYVHAALAQTQFYYIYELMRKHGNQPMPASRLLSPRVVNEGHERINAHLRHRTNIRLTRVHTEHAVLHRRDRPMAFVPR
jgi:hypothetical protein